MSFVDYIDPVQIARFGLTNGGPEVDTLINEKWESFALAPVDQPANPFDYYLFTAVSVECYLNLLPHAD